MNNNNVLRALGGIIILWVMIAPVVFAKNSFLVAPGRVDFDLSRPVTQSFIITNNGDGRIRLSIEPVYFAIDSRSLAAGEPLDKVHPEKDDLRPYIRVSPRALSLKPGQRRDIRISIRPPADLAQGDYRAHLLVRMLETAVTQEMQTGPEGSIGMKIDIKMETAVAVYGHVGERQAQFDVACSRNDDGEMLFDITNPSRWRFEGWFNVFNGSNDQGLPLTRFYVNSLRESRRTVNSKWKPDRTGAFQVRWTDKSGEKSGQFICGLEN